MIAKNLSAILKVLITLLNLIPSATIAMGASANNTTNNLIYAYSCREGLKHNGMEDKVAVQTYPDKLIGYFALFDGHLGHFAAEKAASCLHTYIYKYITSLNKASLIPLEDQIELALFNAFADIEKEINDTDTSPTPSGSTATVLLTIDQKAYIAWLGDSRAIVIRKGAIVQNTWDHRPEQPLENQRLKKLEPAADPYAYKLAVSRSLGNKISKKHYPRELLAIPEIITFDLEPDDMILIASDGLWDFINEQEVLKIISAHEPFIQQSLNPLTFFDKATEKITNYYFNTESQLLHTIAQTLRDYAFRIKHSNDNISVLLVQYKPTQKAQPPIANGQITHKKDVINQINFIRSLLRINSNQLKTEKRYANETGNYYKSLEEKLKQLSKTLDKITMISTLVAKTPYNTELIKTVLNLLTLIDQTLELVCPRTGTQTFETKPVHSLLRPLKKILKNDLELLNKSK